MALGLNFTGMGGLGGLTNKKKEKTLAEKAAAAGTKTDITEPVHHVDTPPEPIIPTTATGTANQGFTVNPDLFKRETDKYHPPEPDKLYTYDPSQYTTGWDKLAGKNSFSGAGFRTGQNLGPGYVSSYANQSADPYLDHMNQQVANEPAGTNNLQGIASDLFGGSGGGSGSGYVSSYADPSADPFLEHMNQQVANEPAGYVSSYADPSADPYLEHMNQQVANEPDGFDEESPEYKLLSNEITPADLQPDPDTPTEELIWGETVSDTGSDDYSLEYDQMFQDIMDKHSADWQNQEDIARAQAASEGRRQAEIAAGMGAAVGGGTFASGHAQAGLKGQEIMMKARKEHDLRGLELQMTNLMNKLKSAEASKDRELQEHLQYMINNTALAIENARLDAIPEIDPAELEAANAERAERGEEPLSAAEYAALGGVIGGFVPGVGTAAGALVGGGYGFLKHLTDRDEDTPWWKVW